MQTAPHKTGKVVRFDVFEADLASGELLKRKHRAHIQELPFRLLTALLEHPGEVVTRESLRQRLWGDSAVEFDDGIHTAVKKLRGALGDSATNPRFIETVPRRGYRFIGHVSSETEPEIPIALPDPEPEASPTPPTAGFTPVAIMAPVPARRSFGVLTTVAAVVLASVLVAAAMVWHALPARSPASPAFEAGEVVPLAVDRGIERSPTLSPDGTRVAFTWSGEDGSTLNLYVQNVTGSGRIRLTYDTDPDRYPAWSPDGKTIAFLCRGNLMLIPALGGPQRTLTAAAGRGLAWSPDSSSLAFSDHPPGEGAAALSVYLIDVASGNRRRLTFPAGSARQDLLPAFAPTGRDIAFVRSQTTTYDVYRVPLSGGVPTRVAIGGHPLQGLVWTPDGRFLLIATGSQTPGLSAAPADAHDLRQLLRVDIAGANVYSASAISIDGGRHMELAVGRETSNWDLVGLPLGGTRTEPDSIASSTRTEQAPAYSPDGKWLAFNSARSGYEEIWVSHADGSDPRELTHFRALASSPRWSPDGNRIVFDVTLDGNRDIYTIRSDGGAPRRLTHEPQTAGQASWSHDGAWIYFMSDRTGSQQIWKMPAAGGAAVEVTRQGGYQALEAPDGKSLYYTRREPSPGLWQVPVGGGPEKLVSDRVWHNFWSVAAGGIYAFDLTGLLPRIFDKPQKVPIQRLDILTGAVTTAATVTTDLSPGLPSLEVRPDGKYIVWVTRKDRLSEVLLIRKLRVTGL